MQDTQFTKVVEETLANCWALLKGKGQEYAGDFDRLENFKSIATDLGVTPEQVCVVYLDKHIRAIKKSIKSGKKSVESNSRILDSINYLFFLQALQYDRNEVKLDRNVRKVVPFQPIDEQTD